MKANTPESIDAYIASCPEAVRNTLQSIRETIRKAAPGATEKISYAIPTFSLMGKPLVYFAAFRNHIGFYAAPTGHKAFQEDLAGYKQGKGSVQFPLDRPIPLSLISRIVRFRVKETQAQLKRK